MNNKRTYRLYREEGLSRRVKLPRPRRDASSYTASVTPCRDANLCSAIYEANRLCSKL